MLDSELFLMAMTFFVVITIMLWRPFDVNETIPTSAGAVFVLALGIVPLADIKDIFNIVSGASLTILSTIMMSIVLDSIGFFKWIALNIIIRSKGSGRHLFFYVILLCFFMTMFFNNDGSILITTPIIIHIMLLLKMKPKQAFPYLISGALIATAASAPIAVSNISNLIAIKIVGLSLNSYIEMMFVPSLAGILLIALMLYVYFHGDIPRKIPILQLKWNRSTNNIKLDHPLKLTDTNEKVDWWLFKVCLSIVVITRAGFFLLSPLGVPIEWVGLSGAFLLILIRWFRTKDGIMDIVKKTPWHILLFAFNMYVLVYGLKNVGLNELIVVYLKEIVTENHFYASMVMGLFLTILSNIMNNLPAVMIGTLSITEMGLDHKTMQIAYLANVIGSDIGSLLTPVGTLATLIWMFLLKRHNVHISWRQYMKVTFIVIPIGLVASLLFLYLWNSWLF
ncbi:arsenic transporter [Domibacillus tundrae]|uniref:arsenic transporter n=1 Tax=Domibacillus tundrae TaxID=1587527 RepID=UPI000617BF73|nr:arsenic transporter [Domibacillus tundrae]